MLKSKFLKNLVEKLQEDPSGRTGVKYLEGFKDSKFAKKYNLDLLWEEAEKHAYPSVTKAYETKNTKNFDTTSPLDSLCADNIARKV